MEKGLPCMRGTKTLYHYPLSTQSGELVPSCPIPYLYMPISEILVSTKDDTLFQGLMPNSQGLQLNHGYNYQQHLLRGLSWEGIGCN